MRAEAVIYQLSWALASKGTNAGICIPASFIYSGTRPKNTRLYQLSLVPASLVFFILVHDWPDAWHYNLYIYNTYIYTWMVGNYHNIDIEIDSVTDLDTENWQGH